MNGKVLAIYIAPAAGELMQELAEVNALAGMGLEGDRYCTGSGSFNKGKQGLRQVTLINGIFFKRTAFSWGDSRRNIIVDGVELMFMIGRGPFKIGAALFQAVKYCDPCPRPSQLRNKSVSFRDQFLDRGGLVAEILEGGLIKRGDEIIPPARESLPRA